MPYPDYLELPERQRRRRQEMEAGRQRILRSIAEGWLERIRQEYWFTHVDLDSSHPDPRQWKITLSSEKHAAVSLEENLFEFPSEEFLAKSMLLGLIK